MGLALAAICVLSAAAAVAVTFLARTRVVAQPVDVDVDAESDLLVACLAQPGLARALHTHPELQLDGASCLTAEAFTADRVQAWENLLTDTADADPTPEQLRLAIQVASVALDRQTYRGHGLLTETGDASAPLRWAPPPVSIVRLAVSAVLVATATAVLAPSVYALAGVAGVAGLVAWLLTGLLVAWVDRDTLCIDLPVAAAGYAAAIACVLVGTGLSTSVIAAAGISVMLTLVLGAFTLIYRRVRGVSGLGTGDLMLLPVLLFVPIALGAPWEIAAWGLGAAGALFVVEAALVRRRSSTPSAFGPALIAGYTLAWAVSIFLG